MSHELKTPLTSIRLYAELLRDGRVGDALKRSKYPNVIVTESERLTRLVNNVLDFTRMGRGGDAMRSRPRIWPASCARWPRRSATVSGRRG